MLGPLGMQEMLLILGLALLIFGPRRLPEMGRTLGRALGEFRRATTDLKRSVQVEMDAEDTRQREEAERKRRQERAAALPAASEDVEAQAPEVPAAPAEAASAEAGNEAKAASSQS